MDDRGVVSKCIFSKLNTSPTDLLGLTEDSLLSGAAYVDGVARQVSLVFFELVFFDDGEGQVDVVKSGVDPVVP